jgi:hypothetical protein
MANNIEQKEKKLKEVQAEIQKWPELIMLNNELDSWEKEVRNWTIFPFHPIRNVAAWGYDVAMVLGELLLSLKNMMSAARYYKENIPVGTQPSYSDEFLSYYAKNALVLIETFKDKLGLMTLSLFEDFDPDNDSLAGYEKVIKKLAGYSASNNVYVKFNADLFLIQLNPLSSDISPDFKVVEEFRHQRIHKMEPRIEIYGKKPFHDWPYLFKVNKYSDFKVLAKKLLKIYPDKPRRKHVYKGCFVKGILYDDRQLSRLYSYDELEKTALNCSKILLSVSAGCFKVIIPLLNNFEELR